MASRVILPAAPIRLLSVRSGHQRAGKIGLTGRE